MAPWNFEVDTESLFFPVASYFEQEVNLAELKQGEIVTLQYRDSDSRISFIVLKPPQQIGKQINQGVVSLCSSAQGEGFFDSREMIIKGGCRLDYTNPNLSWMTADPMKIVIGEDLALISLFDGKPSGLFLVKIASMHVQHPSFISMDRYPGDGARRRLKKHFSEDDPVSLDFSKLNWLSTDRHAGTQSANRLSSDLKSGDAKGFFVS